MFLVLNNCNVNKFSTNFHKTSLAAYFFSSLISIFSDSVLKTLVGASKKLSLFFCGSVLPYFLKTFQEERFPMLPNAKKGLAKREKRHRGMA